MRKQVIYTCCIFLIANFISQSVSAQKSSYRLCDFHQHTTFTDGFNSVDRVFAVCDSLGLAWWANSEHGGKSGRNGILSGVDKGGDVFFTHRDNKGDIKDSTSIWRWQSIKEYSFPYMLTKRKEYANRVIVQGLEWNAPGHEHASMAILANQFSNHPDADPVAQFEYQFDNGDADQSGGKAYGWIKSTNSGHEKTLEGLSWLQKNYPLTSWVIIAHPDRANKWSVADIRDGNNTAPDVFFGFEGSPGHQKSAERGEYAPWRNTYGSTTYGGVGFMCAKVGGLWDALLSEGRRWWFFSTSDYHGNVRDFYPGEYNKTYVYMPQKIEPLKIADYLRSGNSFIVSGNFVDNVLFTVDGKTMGETVTTKQKEVTIRIEVSSPEGAKPLHHIDLIEGVVSDYKQKGTPEYNADSVNTTRIIKSFVAQGKSKNGNYIFTCKLKLSSQHAYYRLRGTVWGYNVPNETDENGNPLPDGNDNTEEKALADQWFYTNPVFVKTAMTADKKQ